MKILSFAAIVFPTFMTLTAWSADRIYLPFDRQPGYNLFVRTVPHGDVISTTEGPAPYTKGIEIAMLRPLATDETRYAQQAYTAALLAGAITVTIDEAKNHLGEGSYFLHSSEPISRKWSGCVSSVQFGSNPLYKQDLFISKGAAPMPSVIRVQGKAFLLSRTIVHSYTNSSAASVSITLNYFKNCMSK